MNQPAPFESEFYHHVANVSPRRTVEKELKSFVVNAGYN